MKAEKISGKSVSGQRTILAEALPLDTPFLVQMFPVYACNFSCNYCIHSLPSDKRGFVASKGLMDFEFYKKCIDDLKEFPQKVKMLRFAATGEPLLHPRIAEMIEYAKKKDIARTIDIVTNASPLTKELSDDLIAAGLDWLRVSVQGTSSEKYQELCGVRVDFDKFIEGISYFYTHRKNTRVYVKIIDAALDDDEEDKFYDIFGSISDKIAIEHLTPAVADIDYSKLSDKPLQVSQNGNAVQIADICPQPFYMMQINPDYNVVPCCSMRTAAVCGNAKEESLLEIWNGKVMRAFRVKLLEHKKNLICQECEAYRFGMFEEDVLDGNEERLLVKYK